MGAGRADVGLSGQRLRKPKNIPDTVFDFRRSGAEIAAWDQAFVRAETAQLSSWID
jgi:hypothetical protein